MGSDVRKKRIAWTILAVMVVAILALCAGGFYIVLRADMPRYVPDRKWIDCPILVESRAAPLVDTIPPFELVLTQSTAVEIDVEAVYGSSFSPNLERLAILGIEEFQVRELSPTQNADPFYHNIGERV